MRAIALQVPHLVGVAIGAIPDLHSAAVHVAVADIEADSCQVSSVSEDQLTAAIDLAEHLHLPGVLDVVPALGAVIVTYS